jgi:hypothetical protein
MTMDANGSDVTVLDRWTIQLAAAVKRYWFVLGIVSLSAGAVGYLLSYTKSVVYRATVTAIAAEQSGGDGLGMLNQLRGLSAIAGIEIGGAAENAESIATLRSRKFAERFMQEAGISRKVCELYCESVLLPPIDEGQLRIRSISAFESYVRRIEEDRQAGVVKVSIIWPDRNEAAVLANLMFSQLNEVLRERARSEAEASLKYLQAELDKTSRVELQQALFRLVERQTARIMAANVTADYAYRIIDPAIPPDVGMPESPRRVIWAVVSAILGGLLALVIVVALGRRSR